MKKSRWKLNIFLILVGSTFLFGVFSIGLGAYVATWNSPTFVKYMIIGNIVIFLLATPSYFHENKYNEEHIASMLLYGFGVAVILTSIISNNKDYRIKKCINMLSKLIKRSS